MVQAATLAPAAAPSPSRQKGQPAKRGALQRVAPPALEAPEEAAEAPAAAPAVEAPAGAAAADALPPDDTSDGESAESDALGVCVRGGLGVLDPRSRWRPSARGAPYPS